MCHFSYPQLLSCAYSYKYLEVLWLPKRTQRWACFNTEPNRLYRRLRLFPSKLQEYTPPPFSRLSTQYHIDPLLACLLSLATSRTSLRLQRSTKFSNRHTAHGRYEYSCNLANSRENWAQKKKIASGGEAISLDRWLRRRKYQGEGIYYDTGMRRGQVMLTIKATGMRDYLFEVVAYSSMKWCRERIISDPQSDWEWFALNAE